MKRSCLELCALQNSTVSCGLIRTACCIFKGQNLSVHPRWSLCDVAERGVFTDVSVADIFSPHVSWTSKALNFTTVRLVQWPQINCSGISGNSYDCTFTKEPIFLQTPDHPDTFTGVCNVWLFAFVWRRFESCGRLRNVGQECMLTALYRFVYWDIFNIHVSVGTFRGKA